MEKTSSPLLISEILAKPTPKAIQVIQLEDGFVELFEKNMIGFGSGKAPDSEK